MRQNTLLQDIGKTIIVVLFLCFAAIALIPGLFAICCLSLYEKI